MGSMVASYATARLLIGPKSAGCRRGTAPGRNPGASARQVRLPPRGLMGPTAHVAVHLLQGGRRRFESVWVHCASRATAFQVVAESGAPCGRGGIGRRTGLRSRRTRSMRVRPSPSVPWREPGRPPTTLSVPDPPFGPTRRPAFCAVARTSGPGSRPPRHCGNWQPSGHLTRQIGVRPAGDAPFGSGVAGSTPGSEPGGGGSSPPSRAVTTGAGAGRSARRSGRRGRRFDSGQPDWGPVSHLARELDGRAPDRQSGRYGFESRTRRPAARRTAVRPLWCSEQHRGVRSPSRQFESGLGCHLALAQRNRALPSEGNGRPFESERREQIGFGRCCRSGRRPVSKTGGGREASGFEPSAFRTATCTARSSSGRTAALTQRAQVRVLHGSPSAGVAHPGPSCGSWACGGQHTRKAGMRPPGA